MGFLDFIRREKQSLIEAKTDEMENAVMRLINLSTNDYGYYLFLILSVVISTGGILLDSVPIIIGGMIVAPLFTPLLACGLALMLFEVKGLLRGVSILLLSVALALILSSVMTYIILLTIPRSTLVIPVTDFISPGLYFFIAFATGIAGAYAFVKPHLSASMAGVAVSSSLIPPLCAVGIGLMIRDSHLVTYSSIIFILNAIGIIGAAMLVFWILGFRAVRHLEEKMVDEVENGNA